MRRRKRNSIELEEFEKTQLVEKDLIDKVSLWSLRIVFKLGGLRTFIDKDNSFSDDNLAYLLDLGHFVDRDTDEFKRSDVVDILKTNYAKLEAKKQLSSSKTLTKNIEQISKLMNLNITEKQILEFFVVLNQYDVLEDASDILGNDLNTQQAKKALASILDIPLVDINNAFKVDSKFSKSSLITIDKSNSLSLYRKFDILNNSFADDMIHLDEDISLMLRNSIRTCEPTSLQLEDYKHLSKDLDIVLPYLKNAIEKKEKGVNILFYGLPGTGKTELTKLISQTLKSKLFEISYADEDEEAIDGAKRLKAFKIAQYLLANDKIVLMYDEAEDIFDSRSNPFIEKRQENKAWLNRMLESNTIPTIWITNNIYSIDNAMVRRFDLSIELPIPPKSKRVEIIKNYSADLLDEKSIQLLAENENIAPALISRASKVVNAIESDDTTEAFTQVLNNTLKAQGYREIEQKTKPSLPSLYNPRFINTTTDLELLTQGIKEHKNARLCLYGAAGTGKSAFGRYIAETLNRPLLLKKGSDLISMYVGGTEQNIASAFEEAKEEDAVLVFDEVDSFLADRTQAQRSWEVTQVNEMLVQMENFEGIFIATTNLMDNLDKASLRRFDLKLEFDYLTPEQSWKMFLSYAKELKLARPTKAFKQAVESLNFLTPGDFAAVVRQSRFRPITNLKDFIARLEDEIAVKHLSSEKVMGFLA